MKTTLEIRDALLNDAKEVSNDHDLALRELIECGLRQEINSRTEPRKKAVWKDLSYGSGGLRPPYTYDDWNAIREASYERDDDG